MDAVTGTVVSTTNSWTGNINVGQPGTITIALSGGFTEKVDFVYTSTVGGTLTNVSLSKTGTNELLINASGPVPFTTATWGTDLQDQNIYSGNDTINGNAYNNSLKGYGGNDRIDGGAGTDTVYFTGLKAQYQITKSGNTMTVSGPDGSDTLLNVERLQFGDKAIAYDTGGIGGQVYRLYQAAFARQPDSPTARQPDSPTARQPDSPTARQPDTGGLGVWINQMDNGKSLEWVSAQFQQSQKFQLRYGANVSTDQFVTLLYQNALHRGPDGGGMAAWSLARNPALRFWLVLARARRTRRH